ncbi:MAG: hypothetical protein ABIR76_10810 [Polaromonas sp.]
MAKALASGNMKAMFGRTMFSNTLALHCADVAGLCASKSKKPLLI